VYIFSIYVAISFFGGVAGMIFVKSLNLGFGLTAVLVIPPILNAVYSMARLKPKEMTAEEVAMVSPTAVSQVSQ